MLASRKEYNHLAQIYSMAPNRKSIAKIKNELFQKELFIINLYFYLFWFGIQRRAGYMQTSFKCHIKCSVSHLLIIYFYLASIKSNNSNWIKKKTKTNLIYTIIFLLNLYSLFKQELVLNATNTSKSKYLPSKNDVEKKI